LSYLDDLSRQLRSLHVPDHLIDRLASLLEGVPVTGMLLYGSWARLEAEATSDLDILVLTTLPARSSHADRVSVSMYTPDQLLTARSTLFGMHLARDGVVLNDPSGELRRILSQFTSPDADSLMARLQHLSAVLDATDDEIRKHIAGFCRLARYLLRTAIYASAIRDGQPCFSLRELANRYEDPALEIILSSHEGVHPEPSTSTLNDLRSRLHAALGSESHNRYKSLRSLIVGAWNTDRELSYLALLILGQDENLPYAQIPKVIL
jgi:predicted nucleotidyltransferase